MKTVQLHRQFSEWQEKEAIDPDLMPRLGISEGLLTWNELLKRQRTVILAEAGSGKTVEMKEQATRQSAAGDFAFYATVEDVGREGLEAALVAEDRARLATWRASDQEAWFFIDSVDEAKLNNIRLDKALRCLADGISGGERRAHIILSGRHTDWEFKRDLQRLDELLPIPKQAEKLTLMPLSPDELLIKAINNDRSEKKSKDAEDTTDKPLVVLLSPLDARRVRMFADGLGVSNLDAFMKEIETANLWRFARRPLDLEWLVQFWQARGQLGSLAEMIKNSIAQRLSERSPGRARQDKAGMTRSSAALERIGAALALARKEVISIPDSDLALSEAPSTLRLQEVLPDWSSDDLTRLLVKPVFDPATFGRARLHNDNQGVVRSYLTAQWLLRLRKGGLSQSAMFDLLFATTYGVPLVKPSMAETAAWLAIWDSNVANEVIRREPFLLLTAGDPASLAPAAARTCSG